MSGSNDIIESCLGNCIEFDNSEIIDNCTDIMLPNINQGMDQQRFYQNNNVTMNAQQPQLMQPRSMKYTVSNQGAMHQTSNNGRPFVQQSQMVQQMPKNTMVLPMPKNVNFGKNKIIPQQMPIVKQQLMQTQQPLLEGGHQPLEQPLEQPLLATTAPIDSGIASTLGIKDYYSILGFDISKKTLYIILFFLLLIVGYYLYTRSTKKEEDSKKKKRSQETDESKQENNEDDNEVVV